MVTAGMAPGSDKERRERAVCFVTVTGLVSLRLFRQYLDHCEVVDFEKDETPEPLEAQQHERSIKEIISISLWLTLVDQHQSNGAGAPEFLKEFMVDCYAVADILYPEPRAKAVLDAYPSDQPPGVTCRLFSENMYSKLGRGKGVADAPVFLGQMLIDTRLDRARLLYDSLSQAMEDLHRRIYAGR
jgi:hypothetical protein